MAYQQTSGLSLLYGGDDGTTPDDDTWAWDGAAWSRVAARGPEPVRWPAFMEHDDRRGTMVMFGGHQVVDESAPFTVGDTWVWRPAGWRRLGSAGQPGPLVNADGVLHPQRGLLLVGGGDGTSEETGRVWRWTGDAWRSLMTGGLVEPGSLERHQDVWEWSGDLGEPAVRVLARDPV